MTFCTNCGSMIGENSRYCGKCGAPAFVEGQGAQNLGPPSYPPQNGYPPPAYPPAGPYPAKPYQNVNAETILGIVPLRQMKSLGRFDPYAGVVTNYRLILAQLTKQMINESVTNARNQAKAQGKGYMGQVSSQMREYSSGYITRFLRMTPALILSETPGNFELSNASIAEIRVRLSGSSMDDDSPRSEYDVSIFCGSLRYDYRTDENDDYVRILRGVYGDRVRTR
jgi:hypothetical protein